MPVRRGWRVLLVIGLLLLAGGCSRGTREMEVTATAFNSVAAQTDHQPNLTAWGETLHPGMKVVAVSRDLIDEGLGYDVHLRIVGLPGKYRVVDKVHRRYRRRIDIYMGKDVDAAREWGKRQVTISWPH